MDETMLRAFSHWLTDYVDMRDVLPIVRQAREWLAVGSFDPDTRKSVEVFLDVWEPKQTDAA